MWLSDRQRSARRHPDRQPVAGGSRSTGRKRDPRARVGPLGSTGAGREPARIVEAGDRRVGAALVCAAAVGLGWGLPGCAEPPSRPTPTAITPAQGSTAAPTAVTITGSGFFAEVSADYNRGQSRVDPTFLAQLGTTPLDQVHYVDSHTLTAVVPAGVALGWHDLLITDPRGRSGRLPMAFQVVPTADGGVDGGRDHGPPDHGPPDHGPPDHFEPDHGEGFDRTAAADAGPSCVPGSMSPDADPFCQAPDLVACYRFEGNGSDGSSNGNHLRLTDVGFAPGILGQAATFSPSSQAQAQTSPSLRTINDRLTIELWVRPDEIPRSGRAGLVDKEGQYGLFLLPGGAVVCRGAAVDVNLPPGTVAPGVWTHLACRFDRGRWTAFRNGSPLATGDGPATIGPNDSALHLGENSPDGAEQLVGRIDEVRIFNVARTDDQICAAARPPP